MRQMVRHFSEMKSMLFIIAHGKKREEVGGEQKVSVARNLDEGTSWRSGIHGNTKWVACYRASVQDKAGRIVAVVAAMLSVLVLTEQLLLLADLRGCS